LMVSLQSRWQPVILPCSARCWHPSSWWPPEQLVCQAPAASCHVMGDSHMFLCCCCTAPPWLACSSDLSPPPPPPPPPPFLSFPPGRTRQTRCLQSTSCPRTCWTSWRPSLTVRGWGWGGWVGVWEERRGRGRAAASIAHWYLSSCMDCCLIPEIYGSNICRATDPLMLVP
jgi:hypothetical protein